ncbi:hypothetical protein AN958_04391 [Leucoagaricus sp. SymC.cos]|nr:hypothetical protein AN958_04391 [Leucoagaricus sp. SymC.cos]
MPNNSRPACESPRSEKPLNQPEIPLTNWKQRAGEAILNPNCAVSCKPAHFGVDFYRVLTSAIPPEIVKYHSQPSQFKTGGLQSLSADDPHNIIKLSSDLGAMFQNDMWILLPQAEIVRNLSIRANNPSDFFDYIKKKDSWLYRFVCISPKMKGFQLAQYSLGNVGSTPINYFYPFDKMPVIQSHVKPHFVICHIGAKTEDWDLYNFLLSDELGLSLADKLVISQCSNVYHHWMKSIPDSIKNSEGTKGAEIIRRPSVAI